jgi:hypothetical protein
MVFPDAKQMLRDTFAIRLDKSSKLSCELYALGMASSGTDDAELKRAVVSALHNAWTIAKYGDGLICTFPGLSEIDVKKAKQSFRNIIDNALTTAKPCAEDDDYRKAQLLLALARGADDIEEKVKLLEEVCNLKWQRGKMIARQNLAVLKNNFESLHDLYETAYRSVKSSAGQDSSDVDFLNWTLRQMEVLFPSLSTDQKLQLRDAQVRITDLVSEVASVTAYRSSFENTVLPRLREIWGGSTTKCINDIKGKLDATGKRLIETTIDQMENYFGRDVVELLRNKPIQDMTEASRIEQAISVHSKMSVAADPGGPLAELTPMASDLHEPFSTWLAGRQAASELAAFREPLRFARNNRSVAMEALDFTANQCPGTLLIQYRILRDGGLDKMYAFAWFEGNLEVLDLGVDPVRLKDQIREQELCISGENGSIGDQITGAKIPSRIGADQIWNHYFHPIVKAFASRDAADSPANTLESTWWSTLQRVVVIPELSCANIPLNLAWEPWAECPLAMSKPLTFSLSLSAFLISGRYKLNRLRRLEDDDAFFLWNLNERDKAAIPTTQTKSALWGYREIHDSLKYERDSYGLVVAWPTLEQLKDVAIREPEVLVIGCHGMLYGSNTVLRFVDGLVSNLLLEQTSFLRRTRLLVLAACESGRSESWYSTMVASLVAAGAGAVVTYPRRCFIRIVAQHAVKLIQNYCKSSEVLELDVSLMRLASSMEIDLGDWATSDEVKIHSSMAQLWL